MVVIVFAVKVRDHRSKVAKVETEGSSKVAKVKIEGRSEVVKEEREYNKKRRVSEAF